MMPGAGAPAEAQLTLPPSLPSWHFAENGSAQGPLQMDQLAAAVTAGRVQRGTLVWTGGMAAWTPAGQVPQLMSLFGGPPPPPLPGRQE